VYKTRIEYKVYKYIFSIVNMVYQYFIGSLFGFLVGSYSARSFENNEFLSYYNYQHREIDHYKQFLRTQGLENEFKKNKF